jgi:hypothetical protein
MLRCNRADSVRVSAALSGWCAKPSRCVQLSTGAKISEGQCAAINPPNGNNRASITTTPSVIPPSGGNASPGAGRGGSTVPSVIGELLACRPCTEEAEPLPLVTSSTVTTVDQFGRPTLSVQQLTMSNPAFTPNTVFGGSAPTGASGTGAASRKASEWTVVMAGILASVIGLVAGFQ